MSITVNEWMLKYEAIVLNRLAVGEIKPKTWGTINGSSAVVLQRGGRNLLTRCLFQR
jgi:hypothetical protein